MPGSCVTEGGAVREGFLEGTSALGKEQSLLTGKGIASNSKGMNINMWPLVGKGVKNNMQVSVARGQCSWLRGQWRLTEEGLECWAWE